MPSKPLKKKQQKKNLKRKKSVKGSKLKANDRGRKGIKFKDEQRKGQRKKSKSPLRLHKRSSTKPPKELGQYTINIEERLGKGAFGSVYKGYHVSKPDTIVAIKIIYIQTMNPQQQKAVKSEVDLLASLKHKNIVDYIDTVKTDCFFCIVLEYVDEGSLQSLLKKHGPLTEQVVAVMIIQILCGLQFLHEQGIIHRDIKAV